jgi:hypothetical protein
MDDGRWLQPVAKLRGSVVLTDEAATSPYWRTQWPREKTLHQPRSATVGTGRVPLPRLLHTEERTPPLPLTVQAATAAR